MDVQTKTINEATYVLQALAERGSVSGRDDCCCRGLGGSISDRRSGSGSGHGGLSQSLHNGAILHHRRSDSVLNCHRLMGKGQGHQYCTKSQRRVGSTYVIDHLCADPNGDEGCGLDDGADLSDRSSDLLGNEIGHRGSCGGRLRLNDRHLVGDSRCLCELDGPSLQSQNKRRRQ